MEQRRSRRWRAGKLMHGVENCGKVDGHCTAPELTVNVNIWSEPQLSLRDFLLKIRPVLDQHPNTCRKWRGIFRTFYSISIVIRNEITFPWPLPEWWGWCSRWECDRKNVTTKKINCENYNYKLDYTCQHKGIKRKISVCFEFWVWCSEITTWSCTAERINTPEINCMCGETNMHCTYESCTGFKHW